MKFDLLLLYCFYAFVYAIYQIDIYLPTKINPKLLNDIPMKSVWFDNVTVQLTKYRTLYHLPSKSLFYSNTTKPRNIDCLSTKD